MYSAALKQSRVFVQQVAGALKEGKLDEAIAIAESNKKSHIAKVVATGLSEFQSASQQVSDSDVIDAAKRGPRALPSPSSTLNLKRGLSALATTVRPDRPSSVYFVGTVVGILNAFKGHRAANKATGLSAVAGRLISESARQPLPSASYVGRPLRRAYNYFHQTKWRPRRRDGQLLDGAHQLLQSCAAARRSNRPWPTSHKHGPQCRPPPLFPWPTSARPADHFHGGHTHVAEDPSGGLAPRKTLHEMKDADKDRCDRSGRHLAMAAFSSGNTKVSKEDITGQVNKGYAYLLVLTRRFYRQERCSRQVRRRSRRCR